MVNDRFRSAIWSKEARILIASWCTCQTRSGCKPRCPAYIQDPACIQGPASISTTTSDPGLYSRPGLYLRPGLYSRKYGTPEVLFRNRWRKRTWGGELANVGSPEKWLLKWRWWNLLCKFSLAFEIYSSAWNSVEYIYMFSNNNQ